MIWNHFRRTRYAHPKRIIESVRDFFLVGSLQFQAYIYMYIYIYLVESPRHKEFLEAFLVNHNNAPPESTYSHEKI